MKRMFDFLDKEALRLYEKEIAHDPSVKDEVGKSLDLLKRSIVLANRSAIDTYV